MLGEPDQNIEIKEENVSSYEEELKANGKIYIQENRVFSKEDNSEIHQQVLIKEEELSDDEDRNVSALCDVDCDIESSNVNGNPTDIEHPADANAGLPLAVFIKEEHEVDKGDQHCDGVSTEEMFSNRANYEEPFGNHFLSNFEDLPGMQGQSEKEPTASATYNGYMEYEMKDKGAQCDESQGKLFKKLGNGHIKCNQCTYTTSKLKKFNIHIKYFCGKKTDIYYCPHCSYNSRFKEALRRHVIARHGSGHAVIECPFCKFASLSFLEVQDHVQKRHNKPIKYYNCEYEQCDFKTRWKGNLDYHIAAKHTLQKNFACTQCDFKCISVHGWKRHMLACHNKRVRCDTTINKRRKRFLNFKKAWSTSSSFAGSSVLPGLPNTPINEKHNSNEHLTQKSSSSDSVDFEEPTIRQLSSIDTESLLQNSTQSSTASKTNSLIVNKTFRRINTDTSLVSSHDVKNSQLEQSTQQEDIPSSALEEPKCPVSCSKATYSVMSPEFTVRSSSTVETNNVF